jgi:lipooligosaccharide transport system permease protein
VSAWVDTLRVVPSAWLRLGRARHLLERNLLVYRHSWVLLLSGIAEPVFYLFAVGVGIGGLVGEVTGPTGQPVPYAQFVTPALLAAAAMNGAVFESTFNVFFKMHYGRIYEAVLATPVGPRDVAVGEIGWSLVRGALYATGFLLVAGFGGYMTSWWGLLSLPAALLIGFAFAAVGMAATTWMSSWQDFELVSLFILPMFLFSATFYPLDIYPPAVQLLTQLSPLYHGVELIRGLMFGVFRPAMLGHAAFLVGMGSVGFAVANRRIATLLRT